MKDSRLTKQAPPTPPPPLNGGNPGGETEPPNKWLTVQKKLTVATIGVYTALLVVVGTVAPEEYKAPVITLVVTLAFCHMVIGSIKVIREQELALLVFFGVILKQWKSGPHYALAPFFYIRRETKNSIQVDFGTLDEKKIQEIQRAQRAKSSQSWYVMTEPVRINWGDMRSLGLSEEEMEIYANDPYANTLTTDPHFYFRIRIVDLQKLVEEIGGLEEAIERIRVTCIRALSEQAGKTFVAKARNELDELSRIILARVEDLVGDPNPDDEKRKKPGQRPNLRKSWGIDVEAAAIQDIGAPHAANTALAARAAAIAEADGEAIATERTATATEKKLVREAAGRAEAVILEAGAEQQRLTKEGRGRAMALKAEAAATQKPGGELVLKTGAIKAVMTPDSKGKLVVVPAASGDLMGALTGVVEALRPPKNEKE